jgi:hypothetical protein
MVAAEPLALVVPDFEASDFIESDALDLDASDFIESLEAAGVCELDPEFDGDEDCARADDSISPLSAVVIINFFSIGEPPCRCDFWRWEAGVRITIFEKAGPHQDNVRGHDAVPGTRQKPKNKREFFEKIRGRQRIATRDFPLGYVRKAPKTPARPQVAATVL